MVTEVLNWWSDFIDKGQGKICHTMSGIDVKREYLRLAPIDWQTSSSLLIVSSALIYARVHYKT